MDGITSLAELRQQIAVLESRQIEEETALRARLHGASEAARPANIIKSAVRELTSAPVLKEQLITALVSLGAGWLAKKLILHESDNSTLGKVIGLLAQYGITAAIASNPEVVKIVSDKIHEALTDLEGILARHQADPDAQHEDQSNINSE